MSESQKKLRFAFFGTPALVAPILDELKNNGYVPEVIITMPDRPQGRKMLLTPPPAKVWAQENSIPVLQPEKLDSVFIGELATYDVALGVVVAYGKILPQTLIDSFPNGMVNVHYSLLPKYRGATPVESAILNGDEKTGVVIQQLEFKLDSGPILKTCETMIGADETAPELRDRLNDMAKDMLVEVVKEIEACTAHPAPQDDSKSTHCTKIEKEDGLIELAGDPIQNFRKYRAYFGWPGIYFFTEKNGQKLRIIIKKARFENGQLVVERVVPEGKKEIDFADFLRS